MICCYTVHIYRLVLFLRLICIYCSSGFLHLHLFISDKLSIRFDSDLFINQLSVIFDSDLFINLKLSINFILKVV